MASRSGKLVGFDGLRALAACTVLTYHVARWSNFAGAGVFAPLIWELKGGVAIFFVISGALLYLPYARAMRDGRPLPDWRGYAQRRLLRIVPAYWVALTVVAIGPFGAGMLAANLWRYYGLSQIYQPQTLFSGLGVAWSLCVEATFYAVLPLFAAFAASRVAGGCERSAVRVQLSLIAGTGLASAIYRGLLAGSLTAPILHGGTTSSVSLPALFDWFAIGMALAVFRAELEAGRAARSALARLGRRPTCCVLLAVGLFLAGVPYQHGDLFLPWYGLETHIALGLGSGLLVLCVVVPRSTRDALVPRLLRHPLATWVGMISYGIYLWHVPVLDLIGPHLSGQPGSTSVGVVVLAWLVVLAGGVGLGAASWYLIERPFQRVFGPQGASSQPALPAGRPTEIDAVVQSALDPLNPSGVAADHLA